ncbi:hypothetical protein [Caldisalinibacter kiritimatiensis]|uniref:PAP2 family protein n=1 Tax=Caldisalinibacter kiritimatiensis TaxID=1304284 RepID=R1ATU7_9FIRM|nr:hypothetical protein [Caldisalinibacter kiritimatiensis]EOD00543.1 hypothetical protein L21TH_1416 [Caldisalinibacter kiritimatiensis]
MKVKVAKLISIITVVPFIALFILTLLYVSYKSIFANNYLWYLISVIFLTVIPFSAYILKNILPNYKNQGRKGERKLAFVMGVIGQITGTITAFVFDAPKGVKIIFLAYLMSGIVLSFTNGVIKFKASGHACGVSGPLTILIYFLGFRLLYTFLILPIVFWARLVLERHTVKELISGTLIGMLSTIIVLVFNNII